MVWAGETRCHLHIPEPSPITAATPAPGTSPTAPTCGGSALDTNFSFKDPLHVLLCTKGNHTAGEDKLSKYGFNCMLSAVLKQQDSSGGWSTELWKRQGIKRDVGAGSQFSFRVVDGSGQPLRLEQGTYRLSVMVQDPDSWFVAFTHKLSLVRLAQQTTCTCTQEQAAYMFVYFLAKLQGPTSRTAALGSALCRQSRACLHKRDAYVLLLQAKNARLQLISDLAVLPPGLFAGARIPSLAAARALVPACMAASLRERKAGQKR